MQVMGRTAMAGPSTSTATTTTTAESLARVAADATRLAANQEFGGHRASPEQRPRPTINTKAGINLINGDRLYSLQRAVGPNEASQRVPSDLQAILDGHAMSRNDSSGSRPTSSQTTRMSPREDGGQHVSSPNIRQFAIPASQGSPMETLPAMQASPAVSTRSPNSRQSLPSLQSQFGDIPPSQTPTLPMPNRQSFSSSRPLQSPPMEIGAMRGPPYTSLHSRANGSYPQTYPATEPSPASTTSAMSPGEQYRIAPNHPRSSSPQSSKYSSRPYQSNGVTPQSDAPTPLSASTQPSMSTLSSESSPNEGGVVNAMNPERTVLPPINLGLVPLINGGFKCEHPGCTALPFQTQYLLNSHANVHSQTRNHYCPVKTCSRSEGGKGFKRKNEMIRHGLVHQSPGYICPFCPEREHKYPRPDNLQRHVRVHHVDKDKDDPLLREVLAQRPEGGPRGRRRRVNS